jgi:uncharacterized protein (TIGR01777 family)
MRVFVTGATGLVGNALVESLKRDGHFVCRLLRKKDEDEQETKEGCDLEWNPQSGEFGPEAQSADAIVNLAGSPIADGRWSEDRKALLFSSRLDTTRGLVAAMERMTVRPKVLVSASAVGYYGNRGDELLTEESSPRADFLSRLSEQWEAEALQARKLGVRVVLARLGIILSKHGGALPQLMLPFKIGVGGKLGTGAQWMSWVAVEDVVRVIRFALENDHVLGPVNVVSPRPVTNAEFATVLAQAMHRPALFRMPAAVLRTLLGEMADGMLLASQRVAPQTLEKLGYSFRYADLRTALADILKS